MLPVLPLPQETPADKMLAIVEQWIETGFHVDNTKQYLLLVLVKAGLDATVLYLCLRKFYSSFISICSLSIFLADMLMVVSLAAVWFLGPRYSVPVSLCFILTTASAIYAAMPLPVLAFTLLDYILRDTCMGNKHTCCRALRNTALTALVWTFAVVYASGSVRPDLMEVYYSGVKTLVCEVQESTLIHHFIIGLSLIVFCILLPYGYSVAQWLKEAERLSSQREEPQEKQKSDLLFNSTQRDPAMKVGERPLELQVNAERLPLWLSMVLCFNSVWLPYLVISVTYMVLGYSVPAYLSVNLLWLECTNSVLVGLLFWKKSDRLGPYSNLPENVCPWSLYWHLSKGTHMQLLPTAVFNPSNEKRSTHYYI